MAEVQPQSAEGAQDHPLVIQHADVAPAPAGPAVESAPRDLAPPKTAEGRARRRAGNSLGGKAKRAVALIGLGQELPTVSLRTADEQLAVLEATLVAVAKGRTSGLVAQNVIALVRAAAQIVQADQGAELEALARRVEELIGGHVVHVRP